METVTSALESILNIIKVVVGLGFVIFVHELGHFLAAKWNKVKVEKFYLGFDFFGTRIWSFKYGETEYGIGGIPLGGYVKMLGEEGGENGERSTDPRAFNNKSAGARIVILSAGVVMNLILALTLFTACQMMGVSEIPARVGRVLTASPAYEAGLREGDDIVSIDGRGDVHFNRMKLKVSLSAGGQKLVFGIKRPGVAEIINIPVEPKRQGKAGMPTIGVVPADSVSFYQNAQWLEQPGMDGPAPSKEALPPLGTIIAAGPHGGTLVPVEDAFALERILFENRDKPVDIKVESHTENHAPKTTSVATLPVNHVLTFGLRMTPGKIKSIQAGSVADKAGFKVNDLIVSVEGREDYDPIYLAEELYARAGKPTKFVVERPLDGKPSRVEITATPEPLRPHYSSVLGTGDTTEPLDITSLGLATDIDTKVAAVAENSPAAKAGITVGSVITRLEFPPVVPPGDKPDAKAKPTILAFGPPPEKPDKSLSPATWPAAFFLLQELPKTDVKLTLEGKTSPITIKPEPSPTWFNPDRGLQLMRNIREVPPQPFLAALKRGTDETYDNVISIYAMIRSLFAGRVSTSNLAGLPRIFDIATQAARAGFVTLLGFLSVLSVNLAVLNFLPIPPLDGGQIAFILAEKVRGKPLHDNVLNVFLIAGLVLVLSLMAFTIGQDIILLWLGKG